MIDILLMLLFVVMITAPLMHAQIDLSLPKSSAARITDESSVTVSVKADGSIYIQTTPVDLKELPRKIWTLKEQRGVSTVALRSDKSVQYGKIMEVIGAIKEGGIDDLGLVAIPTK